MLEVMMGAEQQIDVAELQLEAQKVALKADSEQKLREAKEEAEGMKLVMEMTKEDASERWRTIVAQEKAKRSD